MGDRCNTRVGDMLGGGACGWQTSGRLIRRRFTPRVGDMRVLPIGQVGDVLACEMRVGDVLVLSTALGNGVTSE